MGLVDGLGGEEVNQDVNVQTLSGIFQGPGSFGGTVFAGAISSPGSITGGILEDTDGAVKSVLISQAANIPGMTVVAGSTLTGDTGIGVVDFQAADFANANYYFVATARDYTIPGASGLNIGASGTRRASGLSVLGPSGTVFDWIAVGQR